jgi:uncharacterized membrane protein
LAGKRPRKFERRKSMKSLLQSKLAKRLLMLVALAITLTYLRAPTKANADACTEECVRLSLYCIDNCGTPPEEGCLGVCQADYNACIARCD